jgi:hypothetical protein
MAMARDNYLVRIGEVQICPQSSCAALFQARIVSAEYDQVKMSTIYVGVQQSNPNDAQL